MLIQAWAQMIQAVQVPRNFTSALKNLPLYDGPVYRAIIWTTGKSYGIFWKHKHSYLIFWFAGIGLAPTTNKRYDFKANLMCNDVDEKCTVQCLTFEIHNRM